MATKFRILEKHTEGVDADGDGGGKIAWIDRGEVTAHNRRQARALFARQKDLDVITLVAVLHSEWEEGTIRKKQETVFVDDQPSKRTRLPRKAPVAASADAAVSR